MALSSDSLQFEPTVQFIQRDSDWGDWQKVAHYFNDLAVRGLRTPTDVERWLIDSSELQAALDEERNVREVAMTCQTDDPVREKRYLDFIETIVPAARLEWNRLDHKLLDAPAHRDLPAERWGVLMRRIRNRVELFREANVALQTDDEKLRQQYQKTVGAMTVDLDGREQTLEQAALYLERPDRPKRQEAWEKVWARRMQDRDTLEGIFDEMIALRHRIARNADCADYREYAFRELERFDYTPADCERFHETVARIGVPAARARQRERQRLLGVSPLRPWDLAVDPRNRPPLQPFTDGEALADKCRRIFARISPRFGAEFDRMRAEGLLDLTSRKGKAPGGYMTVFELRRLPFIFMNAVGTHGDVETLLHEGGHAFNAFATRTEPIAAYRHPPIEFAEVASMGMELLALSRLDEFYDGADLRRAQREQLEGIVLFFPWMATVDAFQHWLYTHPTHSRVERKAAWLGLRERFGGIEDFTGYEDARTYMWQRQLHPFTVPFYYVEYGIAQLGALQVWQNSLRDDARAVQDYHAALSLGGRVTLPELFARAGARFDFSAAVFEPLIATLQQRLNELSDA